MEEKVMEQFNKKLTVAAFTILFMSTVTIQSAYGDEHAVKLGFLGGFTGPIESLAPGIFQGAKSAADHISASGGLLGGKALELVTGDSTCIDSTAAANAADRLINSENLPAIVGPMCSGATISAANNAAIPGGAVIISPSATSPAVSDVDDNDLLFRTVPSDSYQGESMAKLLMAKGITTIAITYINNDYGKGFADALVNSYTALGGNVTANEAHEDGKADYRAEIGSLASSGAEHLAVLGYADGSGQTIIRQALESGDFANFIGGDGMLAQSLIDGIGAEALEGMIITSAGSSEGQGKDNFEAMWKEEGFDDSPYAPQAYDATFLLALAMEKKGNAEREGMSEALRAVAGPPGMQVFPGEWDKALAALKQGEDINYEGAAGNQDFDEQGDVAGVIVEVNVQGGQLVEIGPIM
jgi:branched-chain amino acid transport system substrate-binding protein